MSIVSPPGWLQNAGTVNSAQALRNNLNTLLPGVGTMIPRGGVAMSMGGALAVVEDSPASMNVRVFSGSCWVPGTENSNQGAYAAVNDGTVSIALDAAHATLTRVDLIVVRVRDTQYSGGTNNVTLEAVAGTPGAGTPATPSNCLLLATVSVGAAVSTIVTANITDRRWPHDGLYFIRKTADETVNNTTVLQNDDHFTLPLRLANAFWAIDGFLFYDATTAADLKLAWTLPAGAELRWSGIGLATAATVSQGDGQFQGQFDTTTEQFGGIGVGSFLGVHFKGMVGTSTTLGNLQLQWAQGNGDATNTRITQKSWMRGQLVT